jgi:hypothetical protein
MRHDRVALKDEMGSWATVASHLKGIRLFVVTA